MDRVEYEWQYTVLDQKVLTLPTVPNVPAPMGIGEHFYVHALDYTHFIF